MATHDSVSSCAEKGTIAATASPKLANTKVVGASSPQQQPQLIGGKYKIRRKIDYGSFSDIYLGKSAVDGEDVAIKVESANSTDASGNPTVLLPHESKIYQLMQGEPGFPRTLWSGMSGDHNVLVMELLGPNLDDLLVKCMRRFSLKTVLMLSLQMLERVEYMHTMNFIHRDIKPKNFTIGLGKNSKTVYIIDYGLSKSYIDCRTHDHIAYSENSSLSGTPRFSSINAHLGIQQSRRDDLESLGYTLIYLLKGTLPWRKTSGKTNKQKYQKILELKLSTPVKVLCQGLPAEFHMYLNYCRKLEFEETPDYSYLYQLFLQLLQAHGYDNDGIFDWTLSDTPSSGETTPTNQSPTPPPMC